MADRISGDGLQKTEVSYSNRRRKRDSGLWKSAHIPSFAWDMGEQGLVALDLLETRAGELRARPIRGFRVNNEARHERPSSRAERSPDITKRCPDKIREID